jgi:hypothetical protein
VNPKKSFTGNVLQYVRDNPGASGPEIHKHFHPEILKITISGTLARLRRLGLITNDGPRGPRTHWYPVRFEEAEPQFLEEARKILSDLKALPVSERERCLALYLQKMSNGGD